MIDGNQLREEFGRYLAEHKATRWGMDAALMHVCKIAYDAGKADGPGEHLNGAAEILDRALSEHMKRSVKVEQTLLDIASGRRPMLTPDECRTLSLALGTPYEAQTDAQRAMLAADDYMQEAERLIEEYGNAEWKVGKMSEHSDDAEEIVTRENARAALLEHIQRGAVPDGWQLVPMPDVFMYGVKEPDGGAWMGEVCVSTLKGDVDELVDELNNDCDDADTRYTTVSLVTTEDAKRYGDAREAAGYARVLEWAVSRWKDEVKNRPLENKNRRSLDDVWRQVVRFAGGDPDALLGPSHDAAMRGEVKP